MQENYESFMYLTPNDLNTIENRIEELTNKIQEKIYENTQSPLRNIEVGDDLSGKTLYLSFPSNSYENIDSTTESNIITIDENFYIGNIYLDTRSYKVIRLHYTNTNPFLYSRDTTNNLNKGSNPYLNYIRFKLPKDYGVVTEINDESPFYQYIKIYDDENIIPDYIKKEWVTNEIPYMQDIDRIEQGIKNLGDYFTKPIGWITPRVWFETNSITNRNDYCVGSKGLSYKDINRWIHNLNLIEQQDMDDVTIWNTNKTQYYWNEEDD